jgi:galactokinase
VVALMPLERVAAVQQAVQQHYRSPQGQQAQVFVCEAGPGAGPVDL